MNIHALVNYSVADLGTILEWIEKKGHQVTTTNVYENTNFPDVVDFDMLIILGGMMGAYEEEEYPWLINEKQFILETIEANKAVLGICLGSQLIAEVLGGKVYPHQHEEIGWWPVTFFDKVDEYDIFQGLSKKLPFFQYHGDTFDLPNGAVKLAESEATKNQAYIYKDRVVGLQFHPEFSEGKIKKIVELFGKKISPGPYTQSPEEFLKEKENFTNAKKFLFRLLDNFEKIVKNS